MGIEVRSTTRRAKRLGLDDEGPEPYYRRVLYLVVLDKLYFPNSRETACKSR